VGDALHLMSFNLRRVADIERPVESAADSRHSLRGAAYVRQSSLKISWRWKLLRTTFGLACLNVAICKFVDFPTLYQKLSPNFSLIVGNNERLLEGTSAVREVAGLLLYLLRRRSGIGRSGPAARDIF